MDTEEMYRRGLADGERGDLHPFYYEHYYHYRRGYDRARKQTRQPDPTGRPPLRRIGVALLALMLLGVGGVALLRARPQPATIAKTASTATVVQTRTLSTARPAAPTVTPPPTPTAAPLLQAGGRATVANKPGLNARQKPGLKSTVKAKFKDGEQVAVREGPVEVDGFRWWRIEGKSGAGWSAQQSKDGQVWLQPVAEP